MGIGTAAAIIGSAVIGAGASAYSGSKAAKAQKNAAAQQAANERYFYDTTRSDQAPYREAGTGALSKLAQMYGVETPGQTDWQKYISSQPDVAADYKLHAEMSPEEYGQWHYARDGSRRDLAPYTTGGTQAGVADYGGFTASPGYQFRLNEGIKAVERSAAARGLLGSGGTMKGIQRYGEGLASSEYENYANALRSMAGIGQTATQATSSAGQSASQGISNAFQNAGNARASSYANTGAAINNGISNVMGAYLQGGFSGDGGSTFQTPTIPWGQMSTGGIGSGGSVSNMMPSWYG